MLNTCRATAPDRCTLSLVLVAVRTFDYVDRYRGPDHVIAGVTFVSEDSDLAREHPSAFKSAATRDSAIRSEDVVRVYMGDDALLLTAVRELDATATPTTIVKPGRQRRSPVRYGTRSSSTAPPATPADAKPWDLGPTPAPPDPGPLPCIRRYEPSEIGTELRAAAREGLQGICRRTTDRTGLEVAGLLLGHRRADRFIVLRATESNGVGSRGHFVFDSPRDLEAAADECEREGLELLGVWHSEPQRVAYPFPPVVDIFSDADLCQAASSREALGGPALFVLMVRDHASRWQCLPSFVSASDYGGSDIIRPSRRL